VNRDAAIHKQEGCIALGIVARDCEGCFLGAKCIHLQMLVDPKVAKAMAALHAILFSKDIGFFDVIFEGDALQVVREINSDPPYASHIGHFVESIKHELVLFRSSCVGYAPRETNIATHNLAKDVVSRWLNFFGWRTFLTIFITLYLGNKLSLNPNLDRFFNEEGTTFC
jgi:hypothetical protein